MSKELVISSNRHETRVAILEDDQLVEIYFQRANEYSLAGSIHKGRVTRVLPGMQSAFVDLGLERDTFLYVSDFFEENGDEYDRIETKPARPSREGREPREPREFREPRQVEAAAPAPVAQDEPVEIEDPGPSAIAAPVLEDETLDVVSVEDEGAPSAAGSIATPANGNQDQRDRRGRRGRRRRTRGKGFPESKYASDLENPPPAAPAPTERYAALERQAAVERQADEPAAEVFLLPGESLAKYSRPSSGSARDIGQDAYLDTPQDTPQDTYQDTYQDTEQDSATEPDPIELQPDDPDSPVAQDDSVVEATVSEERFEAGQTEAVEQTVSVTAATDEGSPEPLAELAPEATSADEPDQEPEEDPVSSDAVGSAFPDSSFFVPPSASVPAPVESESSAAIGSESDAEDLEQSAAPTPDTEEEQPGIEEPPSESDQPPVEEPDNSETPDGENPPLQASVREQGNTKYQHRSSRRMRRRGRGGDRGGNDRGGNDRGDKNGDRQQVEARTADGAGQERSAVEHAGHHASRETAPRDALRESGSRESGSRESSREAGPRESAQREPQVREPQAREPRESRSQQHDHDDRKSPLPSITDLLKEGQEIIVQIAKEPLGQKGARITSHIALPGRYVVYMPTLEHLGVSRKIASDEERQRLKRILQAQRVGLSGGFIVRTAGEGHTEEEIGADMAYLYNLWLDMRQKAEKKPAPVLLHHDLEIVQRILRDQLSDMYKTIWVDSEDVYESTVRFMQRFQPALVGRVKMYTRPAPIFDAFNVTNEVEKALRPKVWLKSGGYIVINQTEALVAIDVNTGKYVGKSNRLEDTITKTNTEAVKEIVRQIRLRDLGGIIVVDFIDMDERKNRQKVMQALEEAMRADRAPYKILQFNDFGLVAITRKRVKQSLERSLCTPCPTCEGAGYTKSVNTVVTEILQEATKMRANVDGKNVVLRTHPDVAKFLKSNSNDFLEELESIIGRPVLVKSDPLLHPEKFDLAL